MRSEPGDPAHEALTGASAPRRRCAQHLGRSRAAGEQPRARQCQAVLRTGIFRDLAFSGRIHSMPAEICASPRTGVARAEKRCLDARRQMKRAAPGSTRAESASFVGLQSG